MKVLPGRCSIEAVGVGASSSKGHTVGEEVAHAEVGHSSLYATATTHTDTTYTGDQAKMDRSGVCANLDERERGQICACRAWSEQP